MVEIIPKPPEKIPLWQNLIFFLSIAILIIAVFSYFLLGSLQARADQKIKKLNEEIAKTETKERWELKTDLLSQKKKIDDFALVLNKHKFNSNFFTFLEKATHPQVWFNNFNIDFTRGTFGLSGQTENFVTLEQQVIIFQTVGQLAKEITGQELLKVDFPQFSIGKEGKIEFSFNLSFGPPIGR